MPFRVQIVTIEYSVCKSKVQGYPYTHKGWNFRYNGTEFKLLICIKETVAKQKTKLYLKSLLFYSRSSFVGSFLFVMYIFVLQT